MTLGMGRFPVYTLPRPLRGRGGYSAQHTLAGINSEEETARKSLQSRHRQRLTGKQDSASSGHPGFTLADRWGGQEAVEIPVQINTCSVVNMYHPADNLFPLIFCVKVFWLLLYGLRAIGVPRPNIRRDRVFGFEQFTVELRC